MILWCYPIALMLGIKCLKTFCDEETVKFEMHSTYLFIKANPQGWLSVNDAMTITDPSDSSLDLVLSVFICKPLRVFVSLL